MLNQLEFIVHAKFLPCIKMLKDFSEGELQLSQTKTVCKRAVVSNCTENYRRKIAQI